MKHGVDWDIAHSLDRPKRHALCVFYGLTEGGEFDFSTGQWKKRE